MGEKWIHATMDKFALAMAKGNRNPLTVDRDIIRDFLASINGVWNRHSFFRAIRASGPRGHVSQGRGGYGKDKPTHRCPGKWCRHFHREGGPGQPGRSGPRRAKTRPGPSLEKVGTDKIAEQLD